ncbi:putative ABC transporter permease [uncultured Ruminococcus sp.]|uniref:putative ABC transporter permease n=1 Tax=uncultured Ruminococcus sp. TaxID=165186 RepID=UPI0025FD1207|nr:putative ABC transporter permease [uncultured Ruminococcus sp.]
MKNSYSLQEMLIMIAGVSFLGFCLENIWLLLRKGYVDNRNMYLPYLLGYGLALTGFYLILGIPEEGGYLRYFILSFAAVSAGEIVMGETVEHVCGFYYWDYTGLPLHITRYTSVPTSAGFAAIITLFMGNCFTPMMELIAVLPHTESGFAGGTLLLVLTADLVHSFAVMYHSHALNERWRITVFERKQTAARAA